MAIDIRVPTLGESVSEATVGQWFKKVGDHVKVDEPLVELETDKVTVEVPAPSSGILAAISVERGVTVAVGTTLGAIREGVALAPAPVAAAIVVPPAPVAMAPVAMAPVVQAPVVAAPAPVVSPPAPAPVIHHPAPVVAAPPPAPVASPAPDPVPTPAGAHPVAPVVNGLMPPSPAARKAISETGLNPSEIDGSGRRGQILKSDVVAAVASSATPLSASTVSASHPAPVPPAPAAAATPAATAMVAVPPKAAVAASAPLPVPTQQLRVPSSPSDTDREERVKMSRLRQTIARRLKDAQNTAAMLTTFNDVDMSAVMGMRTQYKDLFEKRHGVKLGFMGFFVKACLQALKEIPAVNAEIDGGDIIYKNYYHIGVAVGTDKGLVVPVVREADRMTVAEIESRIADFGKRAKDGKLSIDDMQGGTFTITNGGVYGSLMSTPILNAPQSGILGMHRIEERAVVRKGAIVARPMMTLALSYDHRIVDGKEAVTFLVRVKECLEDPQRFILEL